MQEKNKRSNQLASFTGELATGSYTQTVGEVPQGLRVLAVLWRTEGWMVPSTCVASYNHL